MPDELTATSIYMLGYRRAKLDAIAKVRSERAAVENDPTRGVERCVEAIRRLDPRRAATKDLTRG
jgi:hypothetical protein